METITHYISGWEALNIISKDGRSADWHSNILENIKLYKYDINSSLKDKGIEKRFLTQLNKEYYVATFARAIADLVYMRQTQGLKNCVYDFLNNEDEIELFGYLKEINNDLFVDNFIKYELTRLYFEDKHAATISNR